MIFFTEDTFAAVDIPGGNTIEDVSLDIGSSGNVVRDVSNVWFQVLTIAKRLVMGLLVIYMVYIGAMMIMSRGSDEEQLSSAKRQIWYALVALVFINIPGTLYEAFYKDASTSVGSDINSDAFETASSDTSSNLFFDFFVFDYTINDQIAVFLEIAIFISAIFMLTLAGIKLLTSRGQEERLAETKNKIIYTILALVFVGIIESWKRVAFGGSIDDGRNLMESLWNLALFFAAPVAVFFLTLAWYYYITSNGDEEKVEKAKSIITNTLLATLILLASYAFLLDLSTI